MSDYVNKLRSQFSGRNCYNNFGPCLRRIEVQGFRGIKNINLNIDFPIIAITGLNGSGKSTLGQLAICAYKKPSTAIDYKRQYIKDFFPISKADPFPIDENAEIVYIYETDDIKKKQSVTVSRANSAWSGYKRQPERHCFYIGFTVYIPKVERRDSSVYGGKNIQLTEVRSISENTIRKMAKIIGNKYDNVIFQGISHHGRELEIGVATRLGASYSENNMGFGEGRILYTVDKLENSPQKSLFIIEEPETSLHESAQHKFAKYLLEVCIRKQHQIILSTHSSVIIDALPSVSRKLMVQNELGVKIIDNTSSYHAKSILSDGHNNGLVICVEDDFARMILREAIRIIEADMLKQISIFPMGNTDAVRSSVGYFNSIGINSIGIRDADKGENIAERMFSFPGTEAPEKEVFNNNDVVLFFKRRYSIDLPSIIDRMKKNDGRYNHHNIHKKIAIAGSLDDIFVKTHAIEQYVNSVYKDFIPIVKHIQVYIK